MSAVLVIDPNADPQLLAALGASGFGPRAASDAGAIGGEPPTVVLVRAELSSALLREVVSAMRANAAWAAVPVVLLAKDASDAMAARVFRTGVVEILAEPFDPIAHVVTLRQTLAGLPARAAAIEGGEGLRRFLQHVRRALRSGELFVGAGTPQEGRARFVAGTLASAERPGESGELALLSMLSTRERWRFVEAAPVVAKAQAAASSNEGLPLLLVDDDPDLRRLFATFLKRVGFEVLLAEDGAAGFELACSRPLEVIVADLNMPRLDGWGMLRKLRADARTREIPVAVLSAHDDYREALKAKNAGARAYLAKGNRLEPIAREVSELLAPRRAFLDALARGQTAPVSLAEAGTQWTTRALTQKKATGRLEAEDGWARYAIFFHEGRLVHARAVAGQHEAQGLRALNAFLGSEKAEAAFVSGGELPAPNLSGDLEELIVQAQAVLNRNAAAAEEALLVGGQTVRVDPELYALYAQLGPKHWLEAARLFCEEQLTAREVIAKSEQSPLEVEEVLKDLVRRGVVELATPK